MLVPAKFRCTPSVATSGGETEKYWRDRVEVTPKPGAEMSGFSAPSRRGPWLEKGAIVPRIGVGLQQ